MGLDFSHCNAHWSYRGFHHFRKRIAKAIGINLDKMSGFSDEGKPWPKYSLTPFLYHSDCDGQLEYEELEEIIPALKKIISSWEYDDYDREQAEELIRGMEHAMKDGVPLFFW